MGISLKAISSLRFKPTLFLPLHARKNEEVDFSLCEPTGTARSQMALGNFKLCPTVSFMFNHGLGRYIRVNMVSKCVCIYLCI